MYTRKEIKNHTVMLVILNKGGEIWLCLRFRGKIKGSIKANVI